MVVVTSIPFVSMSARALERRMLGITLMPSLAMLKPHASTSTGTDPGASSSSDNGTGFMEVINIDESDDEMGAVAPPPPPAAAAAASTPSPPPAAAASTPSPPPAAASTPSPPPGVEEAAPPLSEEELAQLQERIKDRKAAIQQTTEEDKLAHNVAENAAAYDAALKAWQAARDELKVARNNLQAAPSDAALTQRVAELAAAQSAAARDKDAKKAIMDGDKKRLGIKVGQMKAELERMLQREKAAVAAAKAASSAALKRQREAATQERDAKRRLREAGAATKAAAAEQERARIARNKADAEQARLAREEAAAKDKRQKELAGMSPEQVDALPDDEAIQAVLYKAIEDAIKAAMECPCVADLKNSACGEAFAGALGCFMSADAEERGSKCVKEFVAMHACMVENSKEFEAFTAELVEAKERR